MRTIIVGAEDWLWNCKTGAVKKAKDLTDIERGAEEWVRIGRAEARKLLKRKRKGDQNVRKITISRNVKSETEDQEPEGV